MFHAREIVDTVVSGISNNMVELLIYGIPTYLFFRYFMRSQAQESIENQEFYSQNQKAGLVEPPSLHPVIDHSKCIGCSSCIAACPEKKVLGLIDERANLVNPTQCIGHGACKLACPADAIQLVFGTRNKGVEIPVLKPNFESNVNGIFIAGELGGMGLIRNAITQGKQALDSVIKYVNHASHAPLDVLIVGAGPAGFSATLGAHKTGLNYRTIEQDSLGGAVYHFPRGKLVMTQPVDLPMVGKVKISETNKENLLGFWKEIERRTQIRINYHERMESVRALADGTFLVKTSKGEYHTKSVMLCLGRRGTPRKLGVPGEQQAKVIYNLIDSAEYQNQHVLVVGGGNSALESAISIAQEPGTTVTLSYRSGAFNRAATKNREKVEELAANNRINVIYHSQIKEIKKDSAVIQYDEEILEIRNDAVIVNAGGILPTPFLKTIGINVDVKYGTA